MKTIEIYARQGDLIIQESNNTPDLKLTTERTVFAGSHDGEHSVSHGVYHCYDSEDESHYVMHPDGVDLVHGQSSSGRHKSVPLRPGVTYRVSSQFSRHSGIDLKVED